MTVEDVIRPPKVEEDDVAIADTWLGWGPIEDHRCSRPACPNVAIAVRRSGSWAQYLCVDHLAQLRRWIEDGQVWVWGRGQASPVADNDGSPSERNE